MENKKKKRRKEEKKKNVATRKRVHDSLVRALLSNTNYSDQSFGSCGTFLIILINFESL